MDDDLAYRDSTDDALADNGLGDSGLADDGLADSDFADSDFVDCSVVNDGVADDWSVDDGPDGIDRRRARRRAVRRVVGALVGVVLPRGCAGCGVPDVVLCGECASGFLMPQRRAMRGVVTGECDGCGVYRSRVRRAVLRWKDHGDEECTSAFARLLCRLMVDRGMVARCMGGVLIVPLPSSPRSVRMRGRWHMLPLARRLAMVLRGLGVDARVATPLRMSGVMGKAVQTVGAGRREDRAREALHRASCAVIEGRRVIVLDDIVTTGATMRRAVHLLREGRAEVVAALALAHAVQRPAP